MTNWNELIERDEELSPEAADAILKITKGEPMDAYELMTKIRAEKKKHFWDGEDAVYDEAEYLVSWVLCRTAITDEDALDLIKQLRVLEERMEFYAYAETTSLERYAKASKALNFLRQAAEAINELR